MYFVTQLLKKNVAYDMGEIENYFLINDYTEDYLILL